MSLNRKRVDPTAPGSTWSERATAVAACAVLGPACILNLAAGETRAATSDARDAAVAEGRGALAGLGDAVTDTVTAAAAPVAEVSSAVRWSVVAIVSLAFLAFAFLITFILMRIGIL
jgi:hypothetical protein